VLIIRRSNCVNTSSGMISVCEWLLGMPVRKGTPDRHTKQSHTLIIPDDVLTQFDLLMMSTVMLETCREMKLINRWKSASSWLLARICNEMHGQRNIKKNPHLLRFWRFIYRNRKVLTSTITPEREQQTARNVRACLAIGVVVTPQQSLNFSNIAVITRNLISIIIFTPTLGSS
jgi:hypothetical protein